MNNIELTTLKCTILAAQETWRDFTPRIRDGAVIVLRGLIQPAAPNGHRQAWIVKNYIVTIDNRKPPQWTCNCKHGGNISGDFFGHPAKVCKHIAAAALYESGQINLDQPKNLLELIDRLLAVQVLPHMPDINFTLTKLFNGKEIKIGYDMHQDACILKLGHKKSKPLIARQFTGQIDHRGDGISEWRKLETFQDAYLSFADEVKHA